MIYKYTEYNQYNFKLIPQLNYQPSKLNYMTKNSIL